MKKLILILAGVLIAGGTAMAQTDSTAGFTFAFTDLNGDGVNDNYEADRTANLDDYRNSPTLNLQYKYRHGLGYGYGFSDTDRNGTNDLLDADTTLRHINPTVKETRLEGLEVIKRGVIRHGKRPDKIIPGQKLEDHLSHDGHNKDSGRYVKQ